MNQYNDKYTNVFYENKIRRLYDENVTNSYDAFYSEIQIGLIEILKKHNFNIYYFYCEPNTELKLNVVDGYLDFLSKDIHEIKKNQIEDIYYLYENNFFEIFFSFPKLNKNSVYYFDFMVITKKDINSFFDVNFKTFKLKSIKKIELNDLTFDYIKDIYEKRLIIYNNISCLGEKNEYDISNLKYGIEKFKNEIKNGSDNFNFKEYTNFESFYFYKKFNNELYIKVCFGLLCSHVIHKDRTLYKQKNEFGLCLTCKEIYNLVKVFLTNYAEIMNVNSININNKEITVKEENYTICTILDNISDQGIFFLGLFVDLKKDLENIDNLEIINEEDYYE